MDGNDTGPSEREGGGGERERESARTADAGGFRAAANSAREKKHANRQPINGERGDQYGSSRQNGAQKVNSGGKKKKPQPSYCS